MSKLVDDLVDRVIQEAVVLGSTPEPVDRKDQERLARKAIDIVRQNTVMSPTPPVYGEPVPLQVFHIEASLVRSKSEPDWYVCITRPFFWCSCDDFQFRHPKICDHLQEAVHAERTETRV